MLCEHRETTYQALALQHSPFSHRQNAPIHTCNLIKRASQGPTQTFPLMCHLNRPSKFLSALTSVMWVCFRWWLSYPTDWSETWPSPQEMTKCLIQVQELWHTFPYLQPAWKSIWPTNKWKSPQYLPCFYNRAALSLTLNIFHWSMKAGHPQAMYASLET